MKIQRLNMDNSWFLDINGTGIVIDPWLTGREVFLFPWFNAQWHRTKPLDFESLPDHDFVLITQKYPDHFHKETLQQLGPTKIAVPRSIEKACKKLLPKAQVIEIDRDIPDIFQTNIDVVFLPTRRKIDPIYDAMVLNDGESSVFIASHGFELDDEQLNKLKALPPVSLLITPFNHYKLPVFLGGVVSPGIKSVEKLIQDLQPQHVVATHDENKFAKGLVSRFARITRAPAPEKLKTNDRIGERYLHIDHYEPVRL